MNKLFNQYKKLKTNQPEYACNDLLEKLIDTFSKKILQLTSFSIEDQVITHLLHGLDQHICFATIDTGRLPQETFDTMSETIKQLHCNIKLLFPNQDDIEQHVDTHGPNGFYNSLTIRKECCHIRKVKPLKKVLHGFDIWITGQRREHSLNRCDLQLLEWDDSFNMIKLNPLFNWTEKQVWNYIKQHNVPYNKLYKTGYTSIGCAPCTRAIKPGEPIRAGRWWWEEPEHKECGLHIQLKHINKKEIDLKD